MEQSIALMGNINGVYELSNAENYQNFVEDVKNMGLSDSYIVLSSDLSNYKNSIIPIQNTAKFTNSLLWIILILGSVAPIAINIFNIRERKYEIGVLIANGYEKTKSSSTIHNRITCYSFICHYIRNWNSRNS